MDASTNDVFAHTPLPDSMTHIRLLRILQGGFDQRVVCKLSYWPVDEAPSHHTISYTWGDPAQTTTITINDRQMTVRQNREYALQQTYTAEKSHYIWIDAICIDQDTIQERSDQVALMGQIYKKAQCVHACVGQHAHDSAYISEVIHKQENFLSQSYGEAMSKPSDPLMNILYSFPPEASFRFALQAFFHN